MPTSLPVPYQLVPGRLRLAASRVLVGSGAAARFTPALAFAKDDEAPPAIAAPSWPGAACAALALTHDIDTRRGLAQVEALLDIEERAGVRSTLFLPGELADRFADRVRGWQTRGFEVGLHDVRHDNRLADLIESRLAARVARIGAAARAFGMRGFRAPSLRIREETIGELPVPLRYDSSLPSYRPAFRSTPARGSRTCRPFRIGRVWELSASLPFDDDLLRWGHSFDEFPAILGSWVNAVAARGGVAVYADHLEPHLSGSDAGRAAYRRFLERHRTGGSLWVATLGEVVRFLTNE